MARDLLDRLRRGLAGEAEKPEQPQLRCLIVDDEQGIRRVISFALRELGIQSEECSSVDAMLAALAQRTADIIFLDVCLEGSDAIQAIRGLEQQGYGGFTQLMSGRDAKLVEDVRAIGEQRNLRMLPILQKPFRPADLRHVIQNFNHAAYAPAQRGVRAGQPAVGPSINLSEALQKGWLELWYQPKLNIQRHRVDGAEGLIRVRHPTHGMLPPASFLPGADEDSLLQLTEFVIVTALRDWQDLSRSEHAMRLSVNAPVSALTSLPIPALIQEHAPKTPRWPGLVIEVTEDQIIRDLPLAKEIATQLSIYNVSLSIDDFGAGYSSFARLKALPFCELKLDRHFVANCATDRTNEGICQTIIDLAHRFGSSAVAEGIENGADLLALYQMDCDIGQGFHLAPPMPKEQLAWSLTSGGEGHPDRREKSSRGCAA